MLAKYARWIRVGMLHWLTIFIKIMMERISNGMTVALSVSAGIYAATLDMRHIMHTATGCPKNLLPSHTLVVCIPLKRCDMGGVF